MIVCIWFLDQNTLLHHLAALALWLFFDMYVLETVRGLGRDPRSSRPTVGPPLREVGPDHRSQCR